MGKIIILAISWMAIIGPPTWAQQDPFGVPDTVRLGNYQAFPHSSFSIPIYIFNDEPLMGLTVPLILKGQIEEISIDSVTFNQGRVGHCQYLSSRIDDTSKSVLIGIIPSLDSINLFVEPGSGEIASLYLTYTGFPQHSIDTISTSTILPYNTLKFVGANITPFVPEFEYGLIELQPTGVTQSSPAIPQGFEVRTYPNPSNSVINLEFAVDQDNELSIQLYNILGQVVFQRNIICRKGLNHLKLGEQQTLNSGAYFLRVSTNLSETITKVTILR